MTPANLDLIAGWASLVLTLLIFSYLLGDNFLYRIAVHVLVGAAAGYIAVVAVESVLIPWFNNTTLAEQGTRDDATMTAIRVIGTVPLLFGVLLLLKFSPRLAPIGNLGFAILIGTGTGIALIGALMGTVIPLARDTGESLGDEVLEGVIITAGVITTLLYFQYFAVERGGRVQRPRIFQALGGVGQFFIAIALGALYAGAIITSLTIFGDVISTQWQFILDRIGG
ncbi:MAG: hypothetical protein GXY36_16040 [Chloroflexi bacterium]|jgi:hypothetical protein|nr:hypothetical protein [Chloroflexota bacterium]